MKGGGNYGRWDVKKEWNGRRDVRIRRKLKKYIEGKQ